MPFQKPPAPEESGEALQQDNGLMKRGVKKDTLPGTLTFIGLRMLDPLLQHAILARGLGSSLITLLGGTILVQGRTVETGISFIDSLDLSPYRLALLSMSVASSLKHIYWKAFIAQEQMSIQGAATICFTNSLETAFNSLVFIAAATSAVSGGSEQPDSPGWPGSKLAISTTVFTLGILIELVAEQQRKSFKDNPENKGKPFTGGLFSLARHINYTGYILWRLAYAFASSGWTYAAVNAAFYIPVFVFGSVPELQQYCERRYGSMWQQYTKQTPYKPLPFIY